MSAARPLRIGVCGTAFWAEAVHLPALKEAPGFELTAVQGRNARRVRALAEAFDIVGHTDFEAFLSAVDAISFAVPPAVQAELAPRAIAAGKHVIVEKPVAPTVEGAEAIGEAVREAGVGAVCFLTRNFIPDLLAFAQDARQAGPVSAHYRFLSSALTPGSPYASSEWRQDRNAPIWDIGPHVLTTLCMVFGPVAQIALERTADGSGVLGTVHHVSGPTTRFEVNQRMPLGPLQETLVVETRNGPRRLEGLVYDRVAAFRRAAAQLTVAIGGDAAAAASFEEAVRLVGVLAAAERSVETGGVPLAPL